MSRRLYLGRLPPDTRSEDVSKFFDGFGRVVDVRVMTGFGFVEFESPKDAEDALHQNGKPFMGANNIVVEFAKETRPRRDAYEDRPPRSGPRSRRPTGVRLVIAGISRDTSWQDLKDFGRDAGHVSFADIDRDNPTQGVLEYQYREDAERAVKELDGKELRGRPVRVSLEETRGGPDNYRREDRYNKEYRRDRDRDRSRSPRRDYEERRRSPALKDERRPAGYDDPRRGGYDDRRQPDYHDDRRRDEYDKKRDDRRRDDKEGYEIPRTANGEGWR